MIPSPQTFIHVFGPGIGVIGRINEVGEFFIAWHGCSMWTVNLREYWLWRCRCVRTARCAGIKCCGATEHYVLPAYEQKILPPKAANSTIKIKTSTKKAQ